MYFLNQWASEILNIPHFASRLVLLFQRFFFQNIPQEYRSLITRSHNTMAFRQSYGMPSYPREFSSLKAYAYIMKRALKKITHLFRLSAATATADSVWTNENAGATCKSHFSNFN